MTAKEIRVAAAKVTLWEEAVRIDKLLHSEAAWDFTDEQLDRCKKVNAAILTVLSEKEPL